MLLLLLVNFVCAKIYGSIFLGVSYKNVFKIINGSLYFSQNFILVLTILLILNES